MKLAATTLGCPTWDIPTIAKNLQENSIEGLEIRGIGGIMTTWEIPALKKETWPETKAILEDAGVKVICLGTSCMFHDPANLEKAMDEGKRTVEIAQRVGADAIRVFGDQLTGSEDEQKRTMERIFAAFGALCDFAAGSGVQICHETHGSFNTIPVLKAEIEAVGNRKEFGIIWDVMHTYRAYGRPFVEVYSLLKPYIHHLHVKDCTPEHRLVPCGEGDIPLPEIVEALKKDGYDGYLSFEWEKVWHPELAEAEIAFPAFAQYFRKLL